MAMKAAPPLNNFPYKRLADLLERSRKVCVVGYELSWESHAPHFNDILKGVWSGLSAKSKINPFASVNDYCVVMNWFNWRRHVISASKPSEAYQTLREMQKDLNLTIATQCVDGLANSNGVESAYELYGNVFQAICHENGHELASWPAFNDKIDQIITCKICGSAVFPNVQMFGWNKKTAVCNELLNQIEKSEALILIGVDKNLTPFNEANAERFARLPMIEILKDGIVLREGKSAYMASINEIENHAGDRNTTSEKWFYKRTMDYLSRVRLNGR